MKRQLITMILLLLVVAIQGIRAQEPYATLSSDNTTLTFYYDNQKSERGGMSVGPFSLANNPSWYDQCGSIASVVFDDSFANCTSITSTAWWFCACNSLTAVTGLEKLNTANVTDMSFMFSNCRALTSLDVSHFNTSNVTDMSYMFVHCEILTSLDVSHFNTANVTNMSHMFGECNKLASLDVSSFNTSNVTDISYMFSTCSALTLLDVSSFNTANVTNMHDMFDYCLALTSLDVRHFNTAKVTDMGSMFRMCRALTSLDVSSFNTANVSDMGDMFQSCSSLTTIYCNDTWSCTNSSYMFWGCPLLKGAIAYDENKTDATYANPDTGYFTRTGGTSVETLNAASGQQNNEACYSLSGQRLTAPQKGINIIGGKKIVIK